jgi:hypothetical protein
MSPKCTISALIGAAVLLAAGTAPAQAATCSVRGVERKLGPTYTTSLSVSGVSCASGRSFVKAFYRCRVANGGRKGRCTKRVDGFRCSERRSNVISTQFDARVSCARGSRRIVHTYTQFT